MNNTDRRKDFFEGWYFKHQSEKDMLAIIPGVSNEKAFIQFITDKETYNIDFKRQDFSKSDCINVANNCFSVRGVSLNIDAPSFFVKGEVKYKNQTPLGSDIMGFFKYFPMQCRHGVVSVYHNISGYINLNGRSIDLSDGVGYIEKDSGSSFPRKYCWIQGNSLNERCSVMVSIADIPLLGFYFTGFICSIFYKGFEYRMATYTGARVCLCSRSKVIIMDRKYRLEVDIVDSSGLPLYAPKNGTMSDTIIEDISCCARFRLFYRDRLIFDIFNEQTSCEFVGI